MSMRAEAKGGKRMTDYLVVELDATRGGGVLRSTLISHIRARNAKSAEERFRFVYPGVTGRVLVVPRRYVTFDVGPLVKEQSQSYGVCLLSTAADLTDEEKESITGWLLPCNEFTPKNVYGIKICSNCKHFEVRK